MWKERNRATFDNLNSSLDRIKRSFISSITSWAGRLNDEEYPLVNFVNMHHVVFSSFWMVDSLFAFLVYNLYTLWLGPVLIIYLLILPTKKKQYFPSFFIGTSGCIDPSRFIFVIILKRCIQERDGVPKKIGMLWYSWRLRCKENHSQ